MALSTSISGTGPAKGKPGYLAGMQRFLRRLVGMGQKMERVRVVVGFRAPYAIWVHENVEMKWRGLPRKSGIGVYWGPTGQAKYLESAAREMSEELGHMIAELVRAGMTVREAVLRAGMRLQQTAQTRVPVEYGNLRASAYTEIVEVSS